MSYDILTTDTFWYFLTSGVLKSFYIQSLFFSCVWQMFCIYNKILILSIVRHELLQSTATVENVAPVHKLLKLENIFSSLMPTAKGMFYFSVYIRTLWVDLPSSFSCCLERAFGGEVAADPGEETGAVQSRGTSELPRVHQCGACRYTRGPLHSAGNSRGCHQDHQ